jgi:CHAD domain-containing protein
MEMRRFVADHASTLLRRLAFRIHRVSRFSDPDSLHDLRVANRRLNECLREFQDFFPHRKAKKVRHELRSMRDLAAEIRNRDVTMELLREGGAPPDLPLMKTLTLERKEAKERLLTFLKQRGVRDIAPQWRRRLDL